MATLHGPGRNAEEIDLAMDTDIGTDVDDILALAMILGSPEVALRAATTVYGDTPLRARMVHRVYSVAGLEAPPIAGGARATRSGKEVWWAGHEGALMPDLGSEPFDESLDADTLLRTARIVAAVGPLTNIANALGGPHDIERLVIMGGDFDSGPPEHNISCDTAAAQAVFDTGTPAVVTGIDQTKRVVLSDAHVTAIERSGPVGKLLAAELEQFRTWLGGPNSPHDPVAVLAAIRPDLFTFAAGTVSVDGDGRTRLERRDSGPHRVVIDLDPDAVVREIVARICRAEEHGR